jgi:hypothetical protein
MDPPPPPRPAPPRRNIHMQGPILVAEAALKALWLRRWRLSPLPRWVSAPLTNLALIAIASARAGGLGHGTRGACAVARWHTKAQRPGELPGAIHSRMQPATPLPHTPWPPRATAPAAGRAAPPPLMSALPPHAAGPVPSLPSSLTPAPLFFGPCDSSGMCHRMMGSLIGRQQSA